MRRIAKLFVVMSLVGIVGLIIISPVQAQKGNFDIGASTLTAVTPGTVNEGASLDVTFTVTVDSPDLEFLSRFTASLPAAWTINSVAAPPPGNSLCPAGGASGNNGQDVWWGQNPDSCGPWANGVYDFSVNVTVTSCSGAPWDLPWLIEGDIWGSTPHNVNGTWSSIACVAAPQTVPTMPQWTLILLSMLLGLVVFANRKRLL